MSLPNPRIKPERGELAYESRSPLRRRLMRIALGAERYRDAQRLAQR
jgi:hypothetical protein